MVRLDCFIFGYRKIRIDPNDLSFVTSVFIRSSISSRINADGEIIVRERDLSKIKELLQGRVGFTCSEVLGLYGWLKKMPNKVAVISALIVSLCLTVILSSVVWDIRVDGNALLEDEEIVIGLSECGLSVGDMWRRVNTADVETTLLQKNSKLAWVNINRRGTVAYVSVMEKEQGKKDDAQQMKYCNIVADRDCVIEEITVKRGVAVVAVGDTVKKGDLLIQGVVPTEFGGEFCAAEGSVKGRVSDRVTAKTNRTYEENTLTGKKIYSIDIKFFKFSLNILKLYGNLTDEYDIIENEIEYKLLGRCRLPFSITVKYLPQMIVERREYTDEEIVNISMEKLNDKTIMMLKKSDLLKIRTYGEFDEKGYTAYSDIVYLSEVGEYVEFYLD